MRVAWRASIKPGTTHGFENPRGMNTEIQRPFEAFKHRPRKAIVERKTTMYVGFKSTP